MKELMNAKKAINRLVRFLIILSVAGTTVTILPAQDTLNGYLTIAAERNPGLKSLFNQYMAALEQIPQVGSLPDPTLAFAVFVSPVETRVGAQRGNLAISQMFPWFGTLKAKEDLATQSAKVQYEAFQEAKIRLFYDVKKTYFELYELSATRRITEENLQLLKSVEGLAHIKFESGKASFADVLRVQLELNELDNTLAYLHDSEAPLQARFEQLLNQRPEGGLILPDTLEYREMPLGESAIKEVILAQSPTLNRLGEETLVWESQEAVAQKMGKPSFNIGFNYINVAKRPDMEFIGNGRDALLMPQVGLSIPLYRKKYHAMVKEATLKKQSATDKKTDVENQLITSFSQAYRDYLDANRRIALYRKQKNIARQALDILLAEYSVAGRDFEDILNIDRKILYYSLELEKARVDQHVSVAYINYLMGN